MTRFKTFVPKLLFGFDALAPKTKEEAFEPNAKYRKYYKKALIYMNEKVDYDGIKYRRFIFEFSLYQVIVILNALPILTFLWWKWIDGIRWNSTTTESFILKNINSILYYH